MAAEDPHTLVLALLSALHAGSPAAQPHWPQRVLRALVEAHVAASQTDGEEPSVVLVGGTIADLGTDVSLSDGVTTVTVVTDESGVTSTRLRIPRGELGSWLMVASARVTGLVGFLRGPDGQLLVTGGTLHVLSTRESPSIFSQGTFFELGSALSRYAETQVRHSQCGVLRQSWRSPPTGELVRRPERIMRDSMWQFLREALRGHAVDREFMIAARKPVDLRVAMQSTQVVGLIEIKWLGKSKSDQGHVCTYGPSRAVRGARQLRDRYVRPFKIENPSSTVQGYLSVYDARSIPATGVSYPAEFTSDGDLRLVGPMLMEAS